MAAWSWHGLQVATIPPLKVLIGNDFKSGKKASKLNQLARKYKLSRPPLTKALQCTYPKLTGLQTQEPSLNFTEERQFHYFSLKNTHETSEMYVLIRTPLPRQTEYLEIGRGDENSRWKILTNQWRIRELKAEDPETREVWFKEDPQSDGQRPGRSYTQEWHTGVPENICCELWCCLKSGEERDFEVFAAEVVPGSYQIVAYGITHDVEKWIERDEIERQRQVLEQKLKEIDMKKTKEMFKKAEGKGQTNEDDGPVVAEGQVLAEQEEREQGLAEQEEREQGLAEQEERGQVLAEQEREQGLAEQEEREQGLAEQEEREQVLAEELLSDPNNHRWHVVTIRVQQSGRTRNTRILPSFAESFVKTVIKLREQHAQPEEILEYLKENGVDRPDEVKGPMEQLHAFIKGQIDDDVNPRQGRSSVMNESYSGFSVSHEQAPISDLTSSSTSHEILAAPVEATVSFQDDENYERVASISSPNPIHNRLVEYSFSESSPKTNTSNFDVSSASAVTDEPSQLPSNEFNYQMTIKHEAITPKSEARVPQEEKRTKLAEYPKHVGRNEDCHGEDAKRLTRIWRWLYGNNEKIGTMKANSAFLVSISFCLSFVLLVLSLFHGFF